MAIAGMVLVAVSSGQVNPPAPSSSGLPVSGPTEAGQGIQSNGTPTGVWAQEPVNIVAQGAKNSVTLNTAVTTTSGQPTITMSGVTQANYGQPIVIFTPNTTNVFQSTISSASGSTVTLTGNVTFSAAGGIAYAYYGIDSTTAINTAWAVAVAANACLYIPAGSYFYQGTGITGWAQPCIYGDGANNSILYLGSGVNFVNDNEYWNSSLFSSLEFYGGTAGIRNIYTGVNVAGDQKIDHVNFQQYSGCAASFNSSDIPYLNIQGSTFYGLNTTNSMGVCNAGSDTSRIQGNHFLNNLADIKLGKGGINVTMEDNDHLKFSVEATPGSYVRTGIWIVPAPTNSPWGTYIRDRFGNENQDVDDVRVLLADTIASSGLNYFGDTLWKTTESSGYVEGITFDSHVAGAHSGHNPIFYSYSPNFGDTVANTIKGQLIGFYPTYLVQFDATVASATGGNQFGPFFNEGTITISNLTGIGFLTTITGSLTMSTGASGYTGAISPPTGIPGLYSGFNSNAGKIEAINSGTSFLNLTIDAAVLQFNSTSGGNIGFGGLAFMNAGLTSSSPSITLSGLGSATGTPGSLCLNASVVTLNAALTCTVSNETVKNHFAPLHAGTKDLMRLIPAQFEYDAVPGRLRWGFGAMQVSRVSHALGDAYHEDGTAWSLDQNAILALTVKTVQEQQKEIEKLKKEHRGLFRKLF